jgi:hypothetical protein
VASDSSSSVLSKARDVRITGVYNNGSDFAEYSSTTSAVGPVINGPKLYPAMDRAGVSPMSIA